MSKECEPAVAELSNADRALVLLSGDEALPTSYSGPDAARAERAIALAFLLHGEAAAREQTKMKLARLKGEGRAEVEKWADRLFRAQEQSGATRGQTD